MTLCPRGFLSGHARTPTAQALSEAAPGSSSPGAPTPWHRIFQEKLDGEQAVIVLSRLNPWDPSAPASRASVCVRTPARHALNASHTPGSIPTPTLHTDLCRAMSLRRVYGAPSLSGGAWRKALREYVSTHADMRGAPRAWRNEAFLALAAYVDGALARANPGLSGIWGREPDNSRAALLARYTWRAPRVDGDILPVYVGGEARAARTLVLDAELQRLVRAHMSGACMATAWVEDDHDRAATCALRKVAALAGLTHDADLPVHAELYGTWTGQCTGLARYEHAPRNYFALTDVLAWTRDRRVACLTPGQVALASDGLHTLNEVAQCLGVGMAPVIHLERCTDAEDAAALVPPPAGLCFVSTFGGRARGVVVRVLDPCQCVVQPPGRAPGRWWWPVSPDHREIVHAALQFRYTLEHAHDGPPADHAAAFSADHRRVYETLQCGASARVIAASMTRTAVQQLARMARAWHCEGRHADAVRCAYEARTGTTPCTRYDVCDTFAHAALTETRQFLVEAWRAWSEVAEVADWSRTRAANPGLCCDDDIEGGEDGESCCPGEHDLCHTPLWVLFTCPGGVPSLRECVDAWAPHLHACARKLWLDIHT